MLLKLHGRDIRPLGAVSDVPFLGRISERSDMAEAARGSEILLLRSRPSDVLPPGFRGYLLHERGGAAPPPDTFELGVEMRYLADGDVVRIDPRRRTVTVLYRRASPSNSLLVTERCDNFCLMCSQPPKDHDDSWIAREAAEVIPLISPETAELGITGGEPGLLGDALVDLVAAMKERLPKTAVHVLSNGRAFARADFAKKLGALEHPDLMIGIPVYSDLPEEHDYVVQAKGAFSETIRGILNLKKHRVPVEVRFVVHAETYRRLPDFARFVARNLLFVDHVALMGLELMGFAKTNLDTLWVDPLDYQEQLVEAVEILDRAGMVVSVYNHQLCTLDPRLHRFSRRSISDWKNTYFDVCSTCSKQSECGGFFASSSLRRSRGIRPFVASAGDHAQLGGG